MTWRVIVGDCVEVMRAEPADSIDAIVTDPPYGLEFMGKEWDRLSGTPGYNERGRITNRPDAQVPYGRGGGVNSYQAGRPMQEWHQTWATEALRVLKPGAHLLAFGGTRTYHRLVCALEDAGFEIRDTLAWMYGSGFPKSLDVSKAIDKIKDWSLVERLAQEIRRARLDAGLSLAEIGTAMQQATAGQYGKWYHRGGHMFFETGRSLPSRSEWEELRQVLPIAPAFASVYDAAEREVIGQETKARSTAGASALPTLGANVEYRTWDRTAPATPAAQQWQGWGTALKPSWESIVLARKPLSEKTVAANVQRWGTGALNIDGTRIGTDESLSFGSRAIGTASGIYGKQNTPDNGGEQHPAGRWPANVLLDEQAAALLDEQSGESRSVRSDTPQPVKTSKGVRGGAFGNPEARRPDGHPTSLDHVRGGYVDAGGASRFFYTAKASRRERTGYSGPNDHPTVKPVALMRWLVKLITPPERPCRTCGGRGQRRWTDGSPLETCPTCNGTGTVGGVVLDPFMGTGTTGIAAVSEGFGFVGIDQDAGYVSLAERRIHNEAGLFSVQEEVTTQEPTR